MIRTLPLLLVAAITGTPAIASEFEDLGALDRRIAELAPAEPIDQRLKLRKCPEAAQLEQAAGMIAVRCPQLGWRLRVPVKALVQGQKADKAVIRRGEAVLVTISSEGYSVSYDGVAMDDGTMGSAIRVKFTTPGVFQTAYVTGPGKVQIED